MKKLLFLLALLLAVSSYVSAQNYTEVVYLKNGSIIKGMIIEQVPNKHLKVKTSDGSLIICEMNDVEKITKEELLATRNRKTKSTVRGYKGSVDAGFLTDISGVIVDAAKVQVSTSHGFQFNKYLYLGGGVALDYYTDADAISVPMFVDFRTNFTNKRIAPFADIKCGYSVGDMEGLYSSLGIGVRFGLKGKKAISLKAQVDYQAFDYNGGYGEQTLELCSVGLKVGFEF